MGAARPDDAGASPLGGAELWAAHDAPVVVTSAVAPGETTTLVFPVHMPVDDLPADTRFDLVVSGATLMCPEPGSDLAPARLSDLPAPTEGDAAAIPWEPRLAGAPAQGDDAGEDADDASVAPTARAAKMRSNGCAAAGPKATPNGAALAWLLLAGWLGRLRAARRAKAPRRARP